MYRANSSLVFIGVAFVLAFQIKLISGIPTLSDASDDGVDQGVPSNIIWPSYIAHLSQAQPNQTFGPKQAPFVYRVPGKNKDIGTQIAFTMPKCNCGEACNCHNRDDSDDNSAEKDVEKDVKNDNENKNSRGYTKRDNETGPNYLCKFAFLDLNEKWGPAEWATLVPNAQDFTIFAYLEAIAVFSPNDTWNSQPMVDYEKAVALVHVSSSGVHIEAGTMNCISDVGGALFWLRAVGNQTCDLSWLEAVQPFSGLVIQKYYMP